MNTYTRISKAIGEHCNLHEVPGYHTAYTAMRERYRGKNFDNLWYSMWESEDPNYIASNILDIMSKDKNADIELLTSKGLLW